MTLDKVGQLAMVVVGLGIPLNDNKTGCFFTVILAIVLAVGAVVWYARELLPRSRQPRSARTRKRNRGDGQDRTIVEV